MKKIIAFGASSSKKSINKTLATYAANLVKTAEVEVLDLNDYEMPIYSVDKEGENGIHSLAKVFKNKIDNADAIVISFAEHNGNVSSAYKNVYDWVSRIDMNVWQGKPLLVLATSPGGRGGQSVLEIVVPGFKRSNENVFVFSLPSFYDNFSDGISNERLKSAFDKVIREFEKANA
jgi:NAD(P)H-dependent FMN reductase